MCARNNSNNIINWGGGHITRPDLNKNASRYEGQVWFVSFHHVVQRIR